jgi:hypothetical protein
MVKPEGGGNNGKKVGFLALGDSIAFGFSPLVTTRADPGAYKGYPEVIGDINVKRAAVSFPRRHPTTAAATGRRFTACTPTTRRRRSPLPSRT